MFGWPAEDEHALVAAKQRPFHGLLVQHFSYDHHTAVRDVLFKPTPVYLSVYAVETIGPITGVDQCFSACYSAVYSPGDIVEDIAHSSKIHNCLYSNGYGFEMEMTAARP